MYAVKVQKPRFYARGYMTLIPTIPITIAIIIIIIILV